jgi:peptide/nickel transport system substrate-binding protein
VDLQVVEWATLIARRNDGALWDIYLTHSAFLPEPMLSPPQLGDGAPGGWNTPAKQATLTRFVREPDPLLRGALWSEVQALLYTEVPYIRLGNFNSLTATSNSLENYVAEPWPFFWNTRLAPAAH